MQERDSGAGEGEQQTTGGSHPARGGAVLAMVVLLATSAGLFGAGSAVAVTDFTAEDVHVVSDGGVVTSLTVAPTGTITYDGLEAEPSTVTVAVMVRLPDGQWETVATKNLSASGREGSVQYDFSTVDLFRQSSLSTADIARPSDGANATTTVEVRVAATLVGAGPNGTDVEAAASDSFDVVVENSPAGAAVGGRANTGGR